MWSLHGGGERSVDVVAGTAEVLVDTPPGLRGVRTIA
jgi:hypothetical protein